MKTRLFLSSLLIVSTILFSCKNSAKNGVINTDIVSNPNTANGENGDGKLPIITLEKETHDFGIITEGEKVTFGYKFKNTGNADLVISDAKGSCGCTVPEYPKAPIKPGEEGNIKVTFDSSGKGGRQNKSVTVITNAIPNTKVLTVTGIVTTKTGIGKM